MERIAGVIGWPVEHSLSPALHNAAFRAAGIDAHYAAFAVPPGEGGAAVAAVRTLGLLGLSVTTPHKEDASGAVDDLSPAAAALRSVNTVVVADDGRLLGHSTDGDGFVASLLAEDVSVAGRRVTVLGAGAAARSVIDALGRAGAAEIVVINRHPDRAQAAAGLAPVGRVGARRDVAAADLVVNATSVGMGTDATPLDSAELRSGQVVADLVYHPVETALLRAARGRGCRAIDGLGMLVHQAVLQQVLWTGVRPDPAVMRAAAEAELARRATAMSDVRSWAAERSSPT